MNQRHVHNKWIVMSAGDDNTPVKYLGMYEGYVDEIALYLSADYPNGLIFKPQIFKKDKVLEPSKKEVIISFNSIMGLSDLTDKEILEQLNIFFENRPVDIEILPNQKIKIIKK